MQVLEYVPDVAAALAGMHRALRPGGRLVVWDIDWSTVSWQSRDPARMERVLRTWDAHLTHPSLPRTLPSRLRSAGFTDVGVTGHAFVSADADPEGFGGSLIPLIERFVAGRDGIGADHARAWAEEQRQLGADGLARFLRLNRSGKGNYTLDRMQWQKDLSVADIVTSLARPGSQ